MIYDHSGSWVLQNLYDIIAYNIVLPPDRWLEKNPRSIAAHVIKGKYEIRLAWGARGNGLGSSVSHQAWLEFRKHLFEAKKVLLAGTKVGQDPFLYAQLIIVAKGLSQDRKKARQYLDKALAIDPYELTAAQSMADYLLPRWYGDKASHQALVEDMVQKTKPKYEDAAYCILCFRAWGDPDDEAEIGLDRKRLHQSLVDRMRHLPNSRDSLLELIEETSRTSHHAGFHSTISPFVTGPKPISLNPGEKARLLNKLGLKPPDPPLNASAKLSVHGLTARDSFEQAKDKLGEPLGKTPPTKHATETWNFPAKSPGAPPIQVFTSLDGVVIKQIDSPELTVDGKTLKFPATAQTVRAALGEPKNYTIKTGPCMSYPQYRLDVLFNRKSGKVEKFSLGGAPEHQHQPTMYSSEDFDQLLMTGKFPNSSF